MSVESETLLARYRQIEREADALGRVIGVRRLRPSEQSKLVGMTPDLDGSTEAEELDKETKQPTGNKMMVSNRLPYQIVAGVCEIDNVKIPFPRSRGELDTIYDRLDIEGLTAAGKCFLRLVEQYASQLPEEVKDVAKNVSGTPGSE